MKKMNKKGFTIVELVIVIAVIAILAAVMIPTFSGIVTKAQQSAALQQLTAAYKEAYAIAMSDDGVANEALVEAAGFQFNFSSGVKIVKVPSGFDYGASTFADGKWTIVKGNVPTVTPPEEN